MAKKRQRNRYIQADADDQEPRQRHGTGRIVSIPYITVRPGDVAEPMRRYLAAPTVVMVCTAIVFILILIGGALPPGFVDPATHRVRFVSDGFKDYRFLPFTCLPFLCAMVLSFSLFARQAGKDTDSFGGMSVPLVGIISLAGFTLVAVFPQGTTHIMGAGCFIFSYALMQLALDMVLWNVHKASLWSRMMEYGILSITILAAVLFCVLLGFSAIMGGDPTLNSWSAVFEYVVFVSFIALNTYGMSLMTYIVQWYVPAGGGGGDRWVPRDAQGGDGESLLI